MDKAKGFKGYGIDNLVSQIKGFEDYTLDLHGNIKHTLTGKEVVPYCKLHRRTRTGYKSVALWRNGKCVVRFVHRLVPVNKIFSGGDYV
jgi:hypothetical protein